VHQCSSWCLVTCMRLDSGLSVNVGLTLCVTRAPANRCITRLVDREHAIVPRVLASCMSCDSGLSVSVGLTLCVTRAPANRCTTRLVVRGAHACAYLQMDIMM